MYNYNYTSKEEYISVHKETFLSIKNLKRFDATWFIYCNRKISWTISKDKNLYKREIYIIQLSEKFLYILKTRYI